MYTKYRHSSHFNVRLTNLLYNLIFYYQIQSKDYAFKASV